MTAFALAVASGLLTALALPQAFPWLSLHPIDPAGHLEWLAWVGLVPSLVALDTARTWKRALAMGFVAGLAYFFAAIWWVSHAMTAFGGIPFAVALLALSLLVAFMAAHWAAAFLASWTVRQRLGWPLWTHLPAIWVGTELCRNYALTGFPWANLGYLQTRHLVVAQLASLGGVYAIAALVVFANCVVHAVLRAALDDSATPWKLVVGAAAAISAVVAFGWWHLHVVSARVAAAPKLTVALVQGNVNQSVKNQGPRHAEQILRRYVPLTVDADARGADLVAWPEAAFPYVVPADLRRFAGARTGLSRLEHAHLILGAAAYSERRLPDGRRQEVGANSVFLLRPDGDVLGRYTKHHLVPFGEYVPLEGLLGGVLRSVVPEMVPQRPGSLLTVLTFDADQRSGGGTVRLAPMICFDAIFPEVNVAFASEDPDLLLNPTNDAWYGYSSGPYQFLYMVSMRAVEAGKAVIRPAYAGVSAVIDPTGAVRPGALPVGPVDPDLAPDPDEPPRMLMAQVPRLRGRTLYTTVGDLFAYAASAYGLAVLVLALMRPRTRTPREGA